MNEQTIRDIVERRGTDERIIVGNEIVGFDGKALRDTDIEKILELMDEDLRDTIRLSIECNTAWDRYLKKIYTHEMFANACEEAKERFIPGYKAQYVKQEPADAEHIKAMAGALR